MHAILSAIFIIALILSFVKQADLLFGLNHKTRLCYFSFIFSKVCFKRGNK